jgi:hypothetical protein
MACPMMSTFTIGALGMAAVSGLGNGAVCNLVPQHFPPCGRQHDQARRRGWRAGRLLPPLVLGMIRQATFTWGFILLAAYGPGLPGNLARHHAGPAGGPTPPGPAPAATMSARPTRGSAPSRCRPTLRTSARAPVGRPRPVPGGTSRRPQRRRLSSNGREAAFGLFWADFCGEADFFFRNQIRPAGGALTCRTSMRPRLEPPDAHLAPSAGDDRINSPWQIGDTDDRGILTLDHADSRRQSGEGNAMHQGSLRSANGAYALVRRLPGSSTTPAKPPSPSRYFSVSVV